ncbi:lipoate--protein ligase family protein [Mediterraneibacter sp. ICN-202921]|uniref:lipoate--protein ligase family protein n=1 Tax=Mediterraneibacter sp. ICN-202921 TaxID=3134657 RepID=UPI0030BB791F
MDAKIVVLDSTDPYTNISREYSYYNHLSEDEVIFLLWRNKPCVVMGRNQNIYKELDLEYIKEQNILPVRRFTGGGCVYHDLGNLNFTFISDQKNKNVDQWMRIILNALKEEGIEAELKGRNDLLSNGKKFSGMAWLEDEEKFLIHGTLMVDLDLSILLKCLTPDMSKFVGKGIKSVQSRVVNLKELIPSISVESLKNSLLISFKKIYTNARFIKHVVHSDEIHTCKMLKSHEWIFGKKEKAQIQRIFIIKGKPLTLDIYINNDIINNVDVFSDTLDLKKVEKLKVNLLGKIYKDLYIENIIKSIWI